MCTLILGLDVAGQDSVILAANRDEDPARPSDPPLVLRERPHVVGGRDRRKGGTWLAIRETRAAVAMLNRRDPMRPDPARRSRGLLALEVAAAADGSPALALEFARAAVREASYAPFTMLFASPGQCWWLASDERGVTEARIASGWHAITHADLDDPSEPRTRWICGRLSRLGRHSPAEAERSLLDLLRSHGGTMDGEPEPAPPICLHEGRMRTVSASVVYLGAGRARYLHIEGRPCTDQPADCTGLLTAGAAAPGRG